MNRTATSAFAGLAFLALATTACTGKHGAPSVQNEEAPLSTQPATAPPVPAQPQLLSTITMSDPASATQLISGFYPIEGNAWRWTAGHFIAVLRTPPGSGQTGAALSLALSVPEIVISHLQSVTLTGSADGTKLQPETYKRSGTYVYHANIPGSLLQRDTLRLDFSLDKSLPPGTANGDKRELGIIVSSLGLAPGLPPK